MKTQTHPIIIKLTTAGFFPEKKISNFEQLYLAFLDEDQKLMRTGKWDYRNRDLLINKIIKKVEKIDLSKLSKVDSKWVRMILWLWYHHATSSAIQINSKKRALLFSEKALEFKPKSHNNKITKLVYLLLRNQQQIAEKWARSITSSYEKKTARQVLSDKKLQELVK